MHKKAFLLIILALLATLPAQLATIQANSTTINVPGDYPTIQQAVDAAAAGDWIEVAAGTYYENLEVTKSLTINGAGSATTIIDGNDINSVVVLKASSITVTGFTIRNNGRYYGFKADIVGGHTIANNTILNNAYGIKLDESHGNTIASNTFISNSKVGIELYTSGTSAAPNTILNNYISGSTFGIKVLITATYNIIDNNTVVDTSYGIYVNNSARNVVQNNKVSSTVAGILAAISSDYTTITGNTVSESAYGIELHTSGDCTVSGNTVSSSHGYGIYLAFASSNTIDGNLASNNDWGIYLYDADSNTIKNNTASYNTHGITILSDSNGNYIYFNNLIRNDEQSFQGDLSSGNTWYKQFGPDRYGNYWTNYNGLDTDDPPDGVGDTLIPHEGVDKYPLMNPTMTVHDAALTSIENSATLVYESQIVNITVTTRNEGTVTETFTVTAKYYSRTIDTKTVTNLDPYESTTLVFSWDTTGVPTGFNYEISAEAGLVVGETDQIDNTFIDGTIRIKILGDINGDDTVNIDDLILLNQAFGSTPTSGNWNSDADLNKDDLIDALDLFLLGQNYDKTV